MDWDFINRFQREIIFVFIGLLLIASGILLTSANSSADEVKVIEGGENETSTKADLVVEISGAVNSPGVYEFSSTSRIDDALNKAGGLREDADLVWVEKTLNRAEKLQDSQKIYIPVEGESSQVAGTSSASGLININTATPSELESLWGIGPVYAQNIIEHRPYSSVDELLNKEILKQNVYERNKDRLTVF